jgi:branched-chain amino acid transport system permease protein
MNLAMQIAANGLMIGLVYVLMALGFTMIFGVMRIVNFAHGTLYMVGGYCVYLLYGKLSFNYGLTIVAAGAAVGLIGLVAERLLFRRTMGNELSGMIMALALAIALQALAQIIFGPDEHTIPRPVSGALFIGEIFIPKDRLVVGGGALAILAVFYWMLKYTRVGLGMRAAAQDAEIAALQGIHPKRMYAYAFVVGSVLAGLAGALMAPIYTIDPHMGEFPMLKAFVVVILGGLGSIPGAVLGGLLIGIIESGFATTLGATKAAIISFSLVIVVIMLRPQGLLGKVTR